MVNELNCSKLEPLIQGEILSIILSYTNLCGTCDYAKKMLTIISELTIGVHYYQINLNLFPQLSLRYAISSNPSFMVFKQGRHIDTFYSFQSVSYLIEKIIQYQA